MLLARQTDCAAARDDVAKPRLTVPNTTVDGRSDGTTGIKTGDIERC